MDRGRLEANYTKYEAAGYIELSVSPCLPKPTKP